MDIKGLMVAAESALALLPVLMDNIEHRTASVAELRKETAEVCDSLIVALSEGADDVDQ